MRGTVISKVYTVAPKGSVELPMDGIKFITGVEIKAKAIVEGKEIVYPTFGVTDNAGVINGIGCTYFNLKGVAIGNLTIENPNESEITLYVTAEQAYE